VQYIIAPFRVSTTEEIGISPSAGNGFLRLTALIYEDFLEYGATINAIIAVIPYMVF
jgi:hypothetical protein